MKFAEIKEMTSAELLKKTKAIRGEIFEAKMKHTLGQLGNPLEIRHKRKDMARLMTALKSKLGAKK